MNLLVRLTEFSGIFDQELFLDSGPHASLPEHLRRSLKRKQLASQRGQAAVHGGNIGPLHHAGPHAVREMQGVDNHKAPSLAVLLHAVVQSLQRACDAVEMLQIIRDRQCAAVFAAGERTVGVRLRQMHWRSDAPQLGARRRSSASIRVDFPTPDVPSTIKPGKAVMVLVRANCGESRLLRFVREAANRAFCARRPGV